MRTKKSARAIKILGENMPRINTVTGKPAGNKAQEPRVVRAVYRIIKHVETPASRRGYPQDVMEEISLVKSWAYAMERRLFGAGG